LPAIPCSKPIHLPPTHFAFLEEGVFLARMIKERLAKANCLISPLKEYHHTSIKLTLNNNFPSLPLVIYKSASYLNMFFYVILHIQK
ncbi:hypothetical protein CN586_26025, partial [Bacillus toyonensis]